MALLFVALGGAVGSGARATIAAALDQHAMAATLTVNVVGAFLLGLLTAWLAGGGARDGVVGGPGRRLRRRHLRLLLGTGFCGGFTTYSAIAVQSAEALRSGQVWMATAYALVTLVAGGLATAAGLAIGERGRSAGAFS